MSDYWDSLGVSPNAGTGLTAPNIETHLIYVDPPLARHWIEHCHYKHQRLVRDYHVERLAKAIRNGTFETSEVNFYNWGEGPKCVNGWHRFHAIRRAGVGVWLTVSLHTQVTEAETRQAYRRYDVGMIRSLQEILNSTEIAADLDLTNFAATRINSAAALIYYRFNERYWRHNRSGFRDYELVLDRIRLWAHEGREYSRAVRMSRGGLRRQLWTRSVMAVALVTYRHQPDRAPLFWEDVACNSGLKRGEAPHTLVTYLSDATHEHFEVNHVMRAVANAWNAWFTERGVTVLKVMNPEGPIKIEGTPFRGVGDKDWESAGYDVAPPIPELAVA